MKGAALVALACSALGLLGCLWVLVAMVSELDRRLHWLHALVTQDANARLSRLIDVVMALGLGLALAGAVAGAVLLVLSAPRGARSRVTRWALCLSVLGLGAYALGVLASITSAERAHAPAQHRTMDSRSYSACRASSRASAPR